ncbi:hypothetical protein SDC9_131000 [bioreactor metagenome]|uniref:Uncharacterized protein n=1 Tax=bioreactor metagenome TaxID=1076179 RepID=A0A645D367_9ZZZZ
MHFGAGDGLQAAGQVHFAHLGAACAQGRYGGFGEALFFQHGGAIERSEIGQVDGLLRRQSPVEDAIQQLAGVVDDDGAARAATAHQQLAVALVEHERGRHRRAWTLAGLHAIGDGRAVGVLGGKAEIGELVVEQKAFDHLA